MEGGICSGIQLGEGGGCDEVLQTASIQACYTRGAFVQRGLPQKGVLCQVTITVEKNFSKIRQSVAELRPQILDV